ncbi:MAG: hypothetical protein PWQ27_383 [Kosmotoga sp.]|nr:hypothetical protein [Kosmotoga sp.]MDK2953000.1 hypothetical protein [Kosmotoga sp.]
MKKQRKAMKMKRIEEHQEIFVVDTNNPELRWEENPAGGALNLISSSGLMKLIHNCTYKIVEPLETPDTIFVVVESSIKHCSSAEIGVDVRIECEVTMTEKGTFSFKGKVFQEQRLVAVFSTVRQAVTLEYLGRKLSEET